MLSPMCGAVTNCFRDITSFIRWDGMHSAFRLKTMRSRWEPILQNRQQQTSRISNVRSMRSQRFMTGIWKSIQQILISTNGHSGSCKDVQRRTCIRKRIPDQLVARLVRQVLTNEEVDRRKMRTLRR